MRNRMVFSCALLLMSWCGRLDAQMSSEHPLQQVEPKAGSPVAEFVDVAAQAGVTAKTNLAGVRGNHHLNEMTGGGVALIDYNRDGWLDIFLVSNGTTDAGQPATNHLFRNNQDGTFTEVTEAAGLVRRGQAQGVSVGDFDGDGWPDLFVTYYGKNVLYRNDHDGRFSDVTEKAGLLTKDDLYSTGSAFLDFDGDGRLDLFVTHYVAYADAMMQDTRSGANCRWRGLAVLCGPRGLKGTQDTLYRNRGDGTFDDVTAKAGITSTKVYGMTPLVGDFNNDGWPDIYVANDSTPSLLFLNNRNGTFTESGVLNGVAYNEDGREQSGMGADCADIDGSGWLSIVKTNFEQDTTVLYRSRHDGTFDDVTFAAGLGLNTSFVGWGVGFLDFDNDGSPDLLIGNGHIYEEVDALKDTSYLQRKILYRNLGAGVFEDVSRRGGAGLLVKSAARGVAFGDLFNSGETDVVVNNLGAPPSVLVNRMKTANHALTVQLVGKLPNELAIGARVTVRTPQHAQMAEVRSGGSYLSQNDLRLRFGLGSASTADVMVRWPDGHVDTLKGVPAGAITSVQYGGKVLATTPYRALPARLRP